MWRRLLAAVLDVLTPETCVGCGAVAGQEAWADVAPGAAPGLRAWDTPHLCRRCFVAGCAPCLTADVDGVPLLSARPATAALVTLVGCWKYQGVRGLGRPLAGWLAPALDVCRDRHDVRLVVPVPLHRGRIRERGFDQVAMLANLAVGSVDLFVAGDILHRRRATDQQASRATDDDSRRCNVAGAFSAREPKDEDDRRVVLVDDLATTGATLLAAAAAMNRQGWQVKAFAVVGCAARLVPCDELDSDCVRPEAVAR